MSALKIERHGEAQVITLNRPDAMNAFSRAMVRELHEAIDAVHDDRAVRAIVIIGQGRAFCAGADLRERKEMSDVEVRQFLRSLGQAMRKLESLPQPVIAAINGFAFGGGLELALACDIRIAAASAKMGLTEVKLGIIPGAGGTQRLPRAIGVSRAKELILTGRRIDAAKAASIGLVSEAVEDDTLLQAALRIADEIAGAAPLAVEQAKFAVSQGMGVDLQTGLAIEAKAYEVLIPTEDRLEALAAFREKRPPNFRGK